MTPTLDNINSLNQTNEALDNFSKSKAMNTETHIDKLNRLKELATYIGQIKTRLEGWQERLEGKGNSQLYYSKPELNNLILETKQDIVILQSDYYVAVTNLMALAHGDISKINELKAGINSPTNSKI